MTLTESFLTNLQSKIFKLLPMRESYDAGFENHIDEYLDNLCTIFDGGFECYPELSKIREMVEVRCNIYALKSNPNIDFQKWRSTILRSTRLIHTVLTRDYGEE